MQDIKEEYADIRKEYYASQKDKTFISLAKARTKKLRTDWANMNIVKPKVLGNTYIKDYDLNSLIPFIDWDPFF